MLEARNLPLAETKLVKLAPFRSVAGIAAFKGQRAALEAALNISLPSTSKRQRTGDVDYLWAGDESWFAMAERPDLVADLTARAAGLAAVTDQSDGRAIFRVEGRDIVSRLVPIDMHPSVFAPDAVALTQAAHIPVQLWQADDGVYEIACFRSFAGALHHALREASR